MGVNISQALIVIAWRMFELKQSIKLLDNGLVYLYL